MAVWQPQSSKSGKAIPAIDLSVHVSQNLSISGSEWNLLPDDILSQLFDTIRAGPSSTAIHFCEVCRSWSKSPTTWRTCPENAPFRPQRCAHLVHLTLDEQPFGYQEAVVINQLPSLRSLHLTHPATVGALSEEIPEGHTLPAPCMLTQLTSLSLTQWPTKDQPSLSGISVLHNLHSFSWDGDATAVPWGALSPLSLLKCLTLSGSRTRQFPLSEVGMTGLEVLDIAGTGWEGFWHILDSLTSVNSITKLICRDAGLLTPNLSSLQNFTALQHLVFDIKLRQPRPYCWDMLSDVTWVTKLDIKWIWVEVSRDQGLALLLQALKAMTQLACLQLSFRIMSRVEKDASDVLAQMYSLSHLARLQELTITFHFRPYIYVQKCVSKLQGNMQAHLEGASVQVTSIVDPIVVLPVSQHKNGFVQHTLLDVVNTAPCYMSPL